MEYGHIPGIDKPISRLVQGTVMVSSRELDRSFALLDDIFELGCNEDNFKRLDRVRHLAEEKSLTLPQIALASVLSQPLNIFALVGCQSGAEFRSNLAASAVRLSPEEMAWLELKSDSVQSV